MTAPTPPSGPATVQAVAGWLAVERGSADYKHIETVVPAVNTLVRRFIPEARIDADDVRMGSVMLAARIVRRRNSPAGVEAFTELGPTYVSRYDPDLDRLLGLGGWRPLVVG